MSAYNQLPEQTALQQMAQIDPNTEALRSAISGSYLTSLQQAQNPTATQFQAYQDLYSQIDPTGYAGTQTLEQQLVSQVQLGSQLDPATQRQVEQATRLAQQGRGNVYGTPQLVEEVMTTGEAGLQLQQQRQQALQSYLQSGQTPGDIAFNVYNQQQNQLRASQGAALSYLGSGSTPYQVGSQYVQNAQNNAATAAQGGPQYNPSSLQPNYSGTAQQFSQYGLDIGQQAQNYYNSMSAQNAMLAQGGGGGGSGMSALMGGVSGALSGAASGAVLGSIIPGLGNLVGAGIGAAVGGALGAGSSYFG
jgi:hypothetical protein